MMAAPRNGLVGTRLLEKPREGRTALYNPSLQRLRFISVSKAMSDGNRDDLAHWDSEVESLVGEVRHNFGGEEFQRVQHLLMLYAAEVDEEYQVLDT